MNEKGAATLVIGLWSIVIVSVSLGLLLDLGKNLQLKNVQNSMAQTAAEHGIKKISTRGSLGQEAVQAAVDEYMLQRNGPLYQQLDGGVPTEVIPEHARYTANSRGGACKTVKIDGVEHEAPYFKATITPSRGDTSNQILFRIFPSSGDRRTVTQITTMPNPNIEYRVLNLTVYDSAQNLMLGVANIVPGIDRDFNCMTIRSEVSAIAFASQGDITGDIGENVIPGINEP